LLAEVSDLPRVYVHHVGKTVNFRQFLFADLLTVLPHSIGLVGRSRCYL